MNYPTLAIIGTAGRKEDQKRLTRHHYTRMTNACITLIQHLGIDQASVKLVSGGAAWADHLVVTLARMGVVDPSAVTLYMPTSLSIDGYRGDNEREEKTASTANYYHKLFSSTTGLDSIRDLLEVSERGATLIGGNGSFHARNSEVAKFVSPDGILLAFTFGSGNTNQNPWTIRGFSGDTKAEIAGLKDGGTADTWSKATCKKYHCILGPTEQIEDAI